jgi:hypothetical protein
MIPRNEATAMQRSLSALVVLLLSCTPALPCTLCGANVPNTATLRQEFAVSKAVLYGTLANAKLNAAGNGGSVDLQVDSVLKSDASLANKKTVQLAKYVPVDPKDPPKYLIFCDIFGGKVDPYRAYPLKSAAIVDYLRGAAALDPKDKTAALLYFFRYLDHADADVAADAYLEFAKANDQEVGQVAKKLDADKLRRLINDPRTPASRLGLYAFLLGACGGDKEADLLRTMLDKPGQKEVAAFDGILAGYIQLRAREGWDMAGRILKDAKKPEKDRRAVLQALHFYHGWKGDDVKRELLACLTPVLPQGDLADLAVEDLRQWQWWDLTPQVLALYNLDSHKAPIVRRAIVRYALCCPKGEAMDFVKRVRADDPATVKAVEESLEFEKKK